MLTPGHYLQIYLAVSNLFYCSLTANKETAFIHAISTAAIIYEIINQCRLNKIPGCGCADVKKQREGNGDWQWGGCSDNIRFGEKETRHFINRLETGLDARTAFNLHNNEVGRKVHLSSSNCFTIRTSHNICSSVVPGYGKNFVSRRFSSNSGFYPLSGIFAILLFAFYR